MRALRAMLVLLPMLAFAGWHQAGTVTVPVTDVPCDGTGAADDVDTLEDLGRLQEDQ